MRKRGKEGKTRRKNEEGEVRSKYITEQIEKETVEFQQTGKGRVL